MHIDIAQVLKMQNGETRAGLEPDLQRVDLHENEVSVSSATVTTQLRWRSCRTL